MGPREPRRDAALRPGPAVGRQRPRRLEPQPQPVHRPAPRRPRPRSTARPTASASSTRATSSPRPRSTRSTRPGSGSGSARTRSPGRSSRAASFATPEAVLVYSDAGLGAMSDALHGLYRERLARGIVARPAAAGPAQQLGGDLLRLRRGPSSLDDRDGRPRPRGRAVRPRRRLVRRARRRRPPRSATGSSTGASCPNGLDGLAGQGRGARHRVRPVDRARDGQRAEPAVRGAPGLGDRRPRPAADREPPAARPRHVAARRSSTTSFGVLSEVLGQRPDLVRQVGHEPDHHRAVQHRACRPTARASSSTATSSASTTCTPG